MNQGHKVLHEYLAVRKLCTRWIPHNLNDAQKHRRINRRCEMMQSFAGGDSNAVYEMVLGIAIMAHPPSAPILHHTIQEKLRGKLFTDDEEAVPPHEKAVETSSKFKWAKYLSHWFHRMRRCIDL
ncbi:hypothetical protein EVAR_23832_1 [Eumeta japonica]|uniref:Mariner Mos1 transposase n=1 Tax=Eumeta variegata TaxID=151549 RepID=A0A4C1VLN2_EUMVA|nr:hypothetical protein EVAR_23832_1 [Eumeta japonica]